MSIEISENAEDSAYIKKKKASVSKKYRPSRSKSIEEANELAVYLYSLGRNNEALKLLQSYSENSPFVSPRYERWEAACHAMLLQAHISNEKNLLEEHRRLIKKVNNDLFNPNH